MSRNPKDAELNDLANSLSRIAYHEAGRAFFGTNLKYCHQVNGRIRVARSIRGTLYPLGYSTEISCAAFFADCMTENLWRYHSDGSPTDLEFNDTAAWSREERAAANPQICTLAGRVLNYLVSSKILPDLCLVLDSRVIARGILSDFESNIKSLHAKFEVDIAERKTILDRAVSEQENNRRHAEHALNKLYRL